MKKGFTLIELLAVILILGIIALIAIPTVNKILNEAREGAFRTSSDNIMKSMEQACQTSLIRGYNPVLSYIFTDGKSSSKLEVKGTMPDDGYVFLDNECSVTDYFLRDKNYTYSNGEDIRQDYMLKAPTEENTSILKTLYPSYYDNIVTVNFINNITVPEGAIEVKDPSVSGGGKIKSWLIEDSGKYNLYVGSGRKIYGNYISSFLFNDLTNMININLTNFDTTFVSTLNSIFMSCSSIKNIDVSNWNTSNVKDMKNVFRGCNSLLSIDVSNWDVRKVSDMFCLFYVCSELKELDLSNWKVDNVTSMAYIFSDCYKLKTLNISNWDINKLTGTEGMLNANFVLNKVIMNNSDYTSVNKIIANIESKTSEYIGTISITGVDNISKVDTTTANSKYWNII